MLRENNEKKLEPEPIHSFSNYLNQTAYKKEISFEMEYVVKEVDCNV